MNFLTFALKRAYWANFKAFRNAFAYFGVTAARFDVMYAIGNGLYSQADVARALGVCRSTVCRLVKKLEKLGLVTRTRPKRDGRCFGVALHHDGVDVVCDFQDMLFRKRILLKTHGDAFKYFPQKAYDLIENVAGNLGALALNFGDHAELPFPSYYGED